MRRIRNNYLTCIAPIAPIAPEIVIIPQVSIDQDKAKSPIQAALDIKLLKQKKYLEVLQEFLEDKYEYTPCCFLSIDDITNDYNEFIKQNDKIKNFNGLFGLVIKDIPLIDNRYTKNHIEFCSSCNKKYFKNCCEEYKSKKDRRAGCCYRQVCIMNIKRKDLLCSTSDYAVTKK